VTSFGVDQSSRPPPSADALVQAGVRFISMYVADRAKDHHVDPTDPSTWPGKCLRPAEVRAYVEAGIQVIVNWETSEDAMISGAGRGAEAARNSLTMARRCGMPADRPVYFSLDTDPTKLTDGQWARVFDFLDGAAGVLGRANVGIYGGLLAVQKALDAKKAVWAWQTFAWSGGQWDERAHIRQFPDAFLHAPDSKFHVNIGGVQCDIDRAMTADFGQWGGREEDMPLNDADKRWLQKEIRDAVNQHATDLFRFVDHGGATATPAPPDHPHHLKAILDRLAKIDQRLQ
jgi:Domain of unknown function (DUF1906)